MHYIAQERETELPTSDVANALQKSEDGDMLNEAGVIYLSTKNADERLLMEKFLLRSLWSSNQKSQYICYCQLRRANGHASQNAHEQIGLFREDPRNIELIDCAKIARWL